MNEQLKIQNVTLLCQKCSFSIKKGERNRYKVCLFGSNRIKLLNHSSSTPPPVDQVGGPSGALDLQLARSGRMSNVLASLI